MTDERMIKDAAAREAATDRVIREMTEVEVSADAVSRVMARVREQADADVPAHAGGGWLGGLFAPRVAWSTAAATAALAAIVSAGLTLVAVRGTGGIGTAGAGAGQVAQATPFVPVVTPTKHTPTGSAIPTGASGGRLDQTVSAAMVMQPDEDPPAAQHIAPLPAGAVPQDVKLDVTITDQSGSTKPVTKTVSLIVADRESGSVQSETRVPFPERPARPGTTQVPGTGWNWENLPLNVNVSPVIMADGHVRVKLLLNYRTAGSSATTPDTPIATATVTKNLTTVLSDGKPQTISTSADAATDRKVTVEMKATIQK